MSFKVQSIVYQPPRGGAASTLGDSPQQTAMDFLSLITAEISNQSPDNPMDDTAMITQYAQMNAAIASQQLASTTQVYQQTNTASSLMNQNVLYLGADGKSVASGTVSAVDFSGDTPTLTIGGKQVPLRQVVKVLG